MWTTRAHQPQRYPLSYLDHNRQFYEEYKKIFTTGYCLSQQLKQLVESKEELWKKLLNYEVSYLPSRKRQKKSSRTRCAKRRQRKRSVIAGLLTRSRKPSSARQSGVNAATDRRAASSSTSSWSIRISTKKWLKAGSWRATTQILPNIHDFPDFANLYISSFLQQGQQAPDRLPDWSFPVLLELP